jgi:tetraacyldisaccharide 4'-kinase
MQAGNADPTVHPRGAGLHLLDEIHCAAFVLSWLPMQRIPPELAPILFVPGLIHEVIVRARNRLYDAGVLKRRRLPGPVISVGNITLGGTGKTPLVLYIAQILAQKGVQPVILTRGYRRAQPNETIILRPGQIVPSAARNLGDEPAVMHRRAAWAWIGISKSRYAAGSAIARELDQPVFILDDGFQHRKLCRDLDIVLLDCSQPLQSNRVFPRGTLREPPSGLHRCDIIMLNGLQNGSSTGLLQADVARQYPKAEVFCCNQTIEFFPPFEAWRETQFDRGQPWPKSAYLVASIGNPGRFEKDVKRLGIEVRGKCFFRDHYWPTPEDWLDCARKAQSSHAEALITTEKDAVKILSPPDFPLMVSVQATVMSDAPAFEQALKRCMERRKSGRAGTPGDKKSGLAGN